MPLPGAQVLISSRLSAFGVTRTSTKPASASQVSVSCDRRGAGDAAAQQRGIALQLGGQRRLVDDIGNRQPPARLQHAKRLAKHLRLVRHQIDHAVREDHIGRVVGDRQMLELAQPEFDIARRRSWPAFSRAFFSISCVMSTPITCPVSPTWPAARKQSKPAPLPRSITVSPGFRCGNRLRIAAAKAEIGAFRHGRELRIRIAHLARFGCRDRPVGPQQDACRRAAARAPAAAAMPP